MPADERVRRHDLASTSGDAARARRIVERTRIFALAESLGGVESLIGHPASMTHASVPPAMRAGDGAHRQPAPAALRDRGRRGPDRGPGAGARRPEAGGSLYHSETLRRSPGVLAPSPNHEPDMTNSSRSAPPPHAPRDRPRVAGSIPPTAPRCRPCAPFPASTRSSGRCSAFLGGERGIRLLFQANAVRVGPTQFPRLWHLHVEDCTTFDWANGPRAVRHADADLQRRRLRHRRPVHRPPFGRARAARRRRDPRLLLAHELGHVMSGHSLYRTIAAILALVSLGALPFLAGIALLPVQLAFLEWSPQVGAVGRPRRAARQPGRDRGAAARS